MQSTHEQAQFLVQNERELLKKKMRQQLKMNLHEAKNLAASLVTSSQLLCRDSLAPDKREKLVHNVEMTSTRFIKLFDKMMTFNFDKEDLPVVNVAFKSIAEMTMDLLKNSFKRKNIEFELTLDPQLSVISANEKEIFQIFYNIIVNACEVVSEEGIVHVTGKVKNNRTIFQVADNGPGISSKNLPRIFDVFTSGKPNGNGFGLKITKELVHKYNGEILVASEVGKGTVFTFSFPLE